MIIEIFFHMFKTFHLWVKIQILWKPTALGIYIYRMFFILQMNNEKNISFFPPASAVEGIKSVPPVCVRPSVSALLAEPFDIQV